ncbi:MAG: hypothetical protein ACJAVT_000542 [Yoonia sp.]
MLIDMGASLLSCRSSGRDNKAQEVSLASLRIPDYLKRTSGGLRRLRLQKCGPVEPEPVRTGGGKV